MPALIHKHEREAIAKEIKDAINEYCRVKYDDGHRNHLGASLIGGDCKRYLWYVFRWVKAPKFDGRMQRLFNRGHKEEDRWIEWLEGIGFKIWSHDDNGNQFRVSGVEKHYGGSLDSVGMAPDWLKLLASVGPILVEYKTYNQKSFDKLVNDGVRKTKPEHWVQMCTYGRYYGYKYALYCPINKNDDDIAPELVELDWTVADENYRKAEEVIQAVRPPVRLSELPSYFKCKFCDLQDVCHSGAAYEKNCRSCSFAVPIKDGQWWCGKFSEANGPLPIEVIKVGCPSWKPVGRNG